MDWVGFATISGFGTLTIASGASLSLNDGILNGVTLDNAGAATLVSYNSNWLTLENGAELVNEPGASFTIPLSDQIKSDDTATAFINEGTLTQIGPTSDQTFIQAASFIQTGTGATVAGRWYPRVRRERHDRRLDHRRRGHDAHVRGSLD